MIEKWLLGHTDAVNFIKTIFAIVETWDDLIDKDQAIDDGAINLAFRQALVDLPRNPFYREHFDRLSPLVESAIYDWLTANELEKQKAELQTAFGLRCTGQSLIVMSAAIIAGAEHAAQVNDEVRRTGETWKQYILNMGQKHGLV